MALNNELKSKCSLLILYWGFTCISLIVHFANYYIGFWDVIEDFGLIFIDIIICLLVCKKNNDTGNYNGAICLIMKLRIVIEVVELMVIYTMTQLTIVSLLIIVGLTYLKLLLDISLYYEIGGVANHGKIWIALNVCIALLSVLTVFWYPMLYLVYFMIAVRMGYGLYLLKHKDVLNVYARRETFFELYSERKSSRKKRLSAFIITGVMIILFCFLRYYKPQTQRGLIDVDGDTKQYSVENMMPEWTGFHKEWWGFINESTGEKTEAKYSHSLSFDDTGIAWDYAGHFVDKQGNCVIKVASSVMSKRSPRTTILNATLETLRGNYNPHLDFWILGYEIDLNNIISGSNNSINMVWGGTRISVRNQRVSNQENLYFVNGVCVFYSEVNGAYGLIDYTGKVILRPNMVYINDKYDYDVIPVIHKITGAEENINR